jgi:hypothetical protein
MVNSGLQARAEYSGQAERKVIEIAVAKTCIEFEARSSGPGKVRFKRKLI